MGDVSQWAHTLLSAGVADASPQELEAAYVRGEIPYIPFAPSAELAEVVIVQAVEDGIVILPTPGRLTSTYVHRDPTTAMETARSYGLQVADSAVLEIRSAAGVIGEGEPSELGSSEGSPLHGAAAIERIVHQVIDTFAHVRPFLNYAWDKDHQPRRRPRQQCVAETRAGQCRTATGNSTSQMEESGSGACCEICRRTRVGRDRRPHNAGSPTPTGALAARTRRGPCMARSGSVEAVEPLRATDHVRHLHDDHCQSRRRRLAHIAG